MYVRSKYASHYHQIFGTIELVVERELSDQITKISMYLFRIFQNTKERRYNKNRAAGYLTVVLHPFNRLQ